MLSNQLTLPKLHSLFRFRLGKTTSLLTHCGSPVSLAQLRFRGGVSFNGSLGSGSRLGPAGFQHLAKGPGPSGGSKVRDREMGGKCVKWGSAGGSFFLGRFEGDLEFATENAIKKASKTFPFETPLLVLDLLILLSLLQVGGVLTAALSRGSAGTQDKRLRPEVFLILCAFLWSQGVGK